MLPNRTERSRRLESSAEPIEPWAQVNHRTANIIGSIESCAARYSLRRKDPGTPLVENIRIEVPERPLKGLNVKIDIPRPV